MLTSTHPGRAGYGASLEGMVRTSTPAPIHFSNTDISGHTLTTLVMWERRPIKLSVVSRPRQLSTVMQLLTVLYRIFLGNVYRGVHVQVNHILVPFMPMESTSVGLRRKSTFLKLR